MRGRDMQEVYEVLENFSKMIGNVSKKTYRNCVVLMTGAAVVALISFNSKEFGGCGKNRTDLMEKQNSGIVIKDEENSETQLAFQAEEIVSVSARDTKGFVKEPGETKHQQIKYEIEEITPETPAESEEKIQKQSEERVADGFVDTKEAVRETVTAKNTEEKGKTAIRKKTEGKEVVEKQSSVETTTSETVENRPVLQSENVVEETVVKDQNVSGRVIQLDDRNYQVLLRIVEAEAGGEGLDGKKLVANVILNRVNHSDFPNTVEAVVFERSGGHVQFSPTADGRFESVVISEETIQAVEAVLCGEDDSQGALFFSARSKADPDNMSWFDQNLKWLFAHGGHEFYTLP